MTSRFRRVGGPPGPRGFDPLEVVVAITEDVPIMVRESVVAVQSEDRMVSSEVLDLVLPGMFRVTRSDDPEDEGIDLGVQPLRVYLTEDSAIALTMLLMEMVDQKRKGGINHPEEVTCPDDLSELEDL